ncbi:MAG: NAD(P)/FAD-dependent oxidoreductase, partial [Chthonomonadaceae bacterium]|nr:NAD(P)/FAD-dependent oxidoreductase [Chthonomonadaceae bacterium]
MTATYDAIVIGAGHNGLIAAGYLARAGRRTLVVERWEQVGGACVTEEVWPGYHVSTAAYLCSLLRPEIVRDLELERYGFEVYRRETSGFAPFPDGRFLFLYPDAGRTREALAAFCKDTPEDIEAFFAFEADVERVAGIVEPFLLREPPAGNELEQAFHRAGAGRLYADCIQGSVRQLLDARFRDEGLKAVLATDGLIGTFGGPSTPGTAYVLLHHYLGRVLGTRGAWGYVRGGMGNITRALAASFRAHGGEIRPGAPAVRIISEHNTDLLRVVLESGEVIPARCVLSSADPYRTFHRLLGEPVEGTAWAHLVTQGGASAKINLAVSELPRFSCLPRSDNVPGPEHLGTVHLCPSLEYLERAWQDA